MRKSILIVDDDEDIRQSMEQLLQAFGYRAASAANGKEALELLADTEPPGVILLDLMMPVMDGEQFRKEQLCDPALSRIPVVLLSADPAVHRKAAALQTAGSVLKPIDLDVLLDLAGRFSAA